MSSSVISKLIKSPIALVLPLNLRLEHSSTSSWCVSHMSPRVLEGPELHPNSYTIQRESLGRGEMWEPHLNILEFHYD